MYSKKDLAYLIGVIYGDGYIKNGTKSKKDKSIDYKIAIELSDIEYLKTKILPIFQHFTQTKSQVRTRKIINRKERGILEIRNKKLFKFLTEDMGIHKGPKKRDIKIANSIVNSSSEFKKEFIAGYFDTDGGFRGNTIGITTNNPNFQDFFYQTVKRNNIEASKEAWINKKYKKEYYGVRIKKDNIDKFLNIFKLRNNKKLADIKARFICAGAGAVKRAGRE